MDGCLYGQGASADGLATNHGSQQVRRAGGCDIERVGGATETGRAGGSSSFVYFVELCHSGNDGCTCSRRRGDPSVQYDYE